MDQHHSQPAARRAGIATDGTAFDALQFILANVPYGRIDPGDLQRGLIQLDGPASKPNESVPHLYWYFDAQPHAIARAIRIPYVYNRTAPTGTSEAYSDAILIGYELHSTPQTAARGSATAATNIATAPVSLDTRPKVVALGLESESLTSFLKMLPDAKYAQPNLFSAATPSGDGSSEYVEYDGLAREYNAANPFPYTFEMVAADPHMYSQLLYWFFGGQFYRLTKAIRLSSAAFQVAGKPRVDVFIGYQGPSM